MKQQINCRVQSCRHNDKHEHCNLSCITVGKNACESPKKCGETECDSFEV